jgi:hypothetical protein
MARIEKPDGKQFRSNPRWEAWQRARLDKDPECTSAFSTDKQIIWALLAILLTVGGIVSGRLVESVVYLAGLAFFVIFVRLSYRAKRARQFLRGETQESSK